MPSQLHARLNDLASQFASAVLAELRSASVDELLNESGHRLRGRGLGTSKRAKVNDRLHRRSAEDIAYTLERVVAVVKKTRGKGMRAEEIRKALGLDVREMPRVLKEGLAKKKLKAKGQKRATTYFSA